MEGSRGSLGAWALLWRQEWALQWGLHLALCSAPLTLGPCCSLQWEVGLEFVRQISFVMQAG